MDNSLINLPQSKVTQISWQGTSVKSALLQQDEISILDSEDTKDPMLLNRSPLHTLKHSPIANGDPVQLTADLPSWATIPASPSEPSDGEDNLRDELAPVTSLASGLQPGVMTASSSLKKWQDTSRDLSLRHEQLERNKPDVAIPLDVSSETRELDATIPTTPVITNFESPPFDPKPRHASQRLDEPSPKSDATEINVQAMEVRSMHAAGSHNTAYGTVPVDDDGSDDNERKRTTPPRSRRMQLDGVIIPVRTAHLKKTTHKITDSIARTVSDTTSTPAADTSVERDSNHHTKNDDPLLLFGARDVSLLPPPPRPLSHPTVDSSKSQSANPINRPRLKFAGVVIPTGPKSKDHSKYPGHSQPKDKDTSNALLAALSNTFRQNIYTSCSRPDSSSTSLQDVGVLAAATGASNDAKEAKKAVYGRKTRNGTAVATSTTTSTPASNATPKIPKIILTEADIDTLLETRVAPVSINRMELEKDMGSFVEGGEMATGQVQRRIKCDLRFQHAVFASAGDSMDTEAHDGSRRSGGEKSAEKQVTAYAYPREVRNEMFVKRLEGMFGEGDASRGNGARPPKYHRKYTRTTVNSTGKAIHSIILNEGSASVSPSSISGTTSRSRSPISVSVTGVVSTGASSFGGDDMDVDDTEKKDDVQLEAAVPSRATIEKWTGTIQTLVKGKVRIRQEDMTLMNEILGEMTSARDYVDLIALKETGLWYNMKLLNEMNEIPFDREMELGVKARVEGILEFWGHKYEESEAVTVAYL